MLGQILTGIWCYPCRMEVEQSYVVRQEELENIRRKDVLGQ